MTNKNAPQKRGTVRVQSAPARRAHIARFVPVTAMPLQALNSLQAGVARLKAPKAGKTAFGHTTTSLAGVVDNELLSMARKGVIDSKQLVTAAFAAVTETSRVAGQPAAKQVLATFTKVADHLKCWTSSAHFKRYLSKRMAAAGYSGGHAAEIVTLMRPAVAAIRADVMAARRAAKAYYADKKA